MKNKMIGIVIMMLLVAIITISVIGTMNSHDYEQYQYDVIDQSLTIGSSFQDFDHDWLPTTADNTELVYHEGAVKIGSSGSVINGKMQLTSDQPSNPIINAPPFAQLLIGGATTNQKNQLRLGFNEISNEAFIQAIESSNFSGQLQQFPLKLNNVFEIRSNGEIHYTNYYPWLTFFRTNGDGSWRIGGTAGSSGSGFDFRIYQTDPTPEIKFCIEEDSGYIGFGTSQPETELHIIGQSPVGNADIRLEAQDGDAWNIGCGNKFWIATVDENGQYEDQVEISNDGEVEIKTLRLTGGSDIAEPFLISNLNECAPGMVMVIDVKNPGSLRVSDQAYDRCVAGVISGAGGVEPGIILNQDDIFYGNHHVALNGRVYGYCDASFGRIQPGDLLTTSPNPGHAMKVKDFEQAQGAIIGKAMSSLDEGTGLVLILVSLQ